MPEEFPAQPVPAILAGYDPQSPTFEPSQPPQKPLQKRKHHPIRTLFVLLFTAALLGAAAFFGWQAYQNFERYNAAYRAYEQTLTQYQADLTKLRATSDQIEQYHQLFGIKSVDDFLVFEGDDPLVEWYKQVEDQLNSIEAQAKAIPDPEQTPRDEVSAWISPQASVNIDNETAALRTNEQGLQNALDYAPDQDSINRVAAAQKNCADYVVKIKQSIAAASAPATDALDTKAYVQAINTFGIDIKFTGTSRTECGANTVGCSQVAANWIELSDVKLNNPSLTQQDRHQTVAHEVCHHILGHLQPSYLNNKLRYEHETEACAFVLYNQIATHKSTDSMYNYAPEDVAYIDLIVQKFHLK